MVLGKPNTPTLRRTTSGDIDPEADLFGPQLDHRDFLPAISPWSTLGGWLILGTFGSLAALAALTPFQQVVTAPATVRPQGETRLVQSRLAGSVSQIFVREGQMVSPGTPIAAIDPTQWQLQRQQLATTLQNTQAQLDKVTAQLQALNQQIASEATLNERTLIAAQAELARNQRELQNQTVAATTQVQEAEAALKLAQTELKRYQNLVRAGAVSELEVLTREEAFKAAQARLVRAKSLLNPSRAPLTVAAEQIRQSEAKGLARIAELRQTQQDINQQRLELQDSFNRTQKAQEQLSQDLRHTTIVSPLGGKILQLNLRNIAQMVQTGETIVQIEPSQVPLVIHARVLVSDIAQIRACPTPAPTNSAPSTCQGSPVQMRVSAYPYPDYGILRGHVTRIAADATTADNQPAYYQVSITPEHPYLERGGKRYLLQSGMEVSAEIISSQETVLTFLLRKARLWGGV